jgi:hypothetical protein
MAVNLSDIRQRLPQLSARELQQRIPVKDAAKLNHIHEDTYRRHFADTIERVGPRLERVPLGVALNVGQPKTK